MAAHPCGTFCLATSLHNQKHSQHPSEKHTRLKLINLYRNASSIFTIALF